MEDEDPDELYGSAATGTEESVLTYAKPSEATFSMFDFAPAGLALETVEETLPSCFVRRDVDHIEVEKCNDSKCFVDLWDGLQEAGFTVGPNAKVVEGAEDRHRMIRAILEEVSKASRKQVPKVK